jgi:hypothetical protein
VEPDRRRVQVAVRVGALGFVVAWLFSPSLQARIPWWLAFVVLAATEVEFVVRARLGSAPVSDVAERRAPGAEDADLGWGTLETDEEGVRWVAPPPRPPRTPWSRVAAGATLALAVALLVLAARADGGKSWNDLSDDARARTERVITTEAARIAGRVVTVECDRTYAFTGAASDALGVAFPRRALAFLHPSVCRALHDLAVAGDTSEREWTAEAIVVLAHEAVHLAGVRDEGVTECRALQEGVELGRRLGLPPDRAQRMMRSRYTVALAERSVVRVEYALPRGCESGGAYDVYPDRDGFP